MEPKALGVQERYVRRALSGLCAGVEVQHTLYPCMASRSPISSGNAGVSDQGRSPLCKMLLRRQGLVGPCHIV